MKSFVNVVAAIAALLAGLVGNETAWSVGWADLTTIELRNTRGQSIELAEADYSVFCFLGTECPLAKLYGPRLQRLANEYGSRGVQFVGVNSNHQDSPSEIDEYARSHDLRFPIAKDANQKVADALGATRTPEVFVVDRKGLIRYRGRIDDQYTPGVTRNKPEINDLANALDDLLADRPVRVPETTGVGCLITRVAEHKRAAASEATVTFNRDVAPILFRNCVECHREGEIAPMALTDYDEVVGWAEMIVEVIENRRMPPWHADPEIGSFVGQRTMPEDAKSVIRRWIEEGMHRGDEQDRPPTPKYASGWHAQREPDQQFDMRDRPFKVPSEGTVEYQYFVVDPKWTEDQWVNLAQVIPGDPSVVHHCIAFLRPPDDRQFHGIGWLGAYVPGQRPIQLPNGHARLAPARSKIIFQMHYTPNGRETFDKTKAGIWTIPANEVTHQVITEIAIDHEFEIPPGDSNYQVNLADYSFAPGGRVLGIAPHMHLRGKSFRMDVEYKTGTREPTLSVPHYDFNWQHYYQFAEPIDLDSVESLQMSVAFDNSDRNPFNPAPDEYVSWGDQTWEEMAIAFYDVAVPRNQPAPMQMRRHRPAEEQSAGHSNRIARLTDEFIEKLDRNGNGIVERGETPVTFRDFGFRRFDRNRDGILDREEIERAASANGSSAIR